MHSIDDIPPLRQNPREEDDRDGARIEYKNDLWRSQDWALRQRDRQIEENIKMLAGQQWSVWSDLLGKWVDVSEELTDDERRWRQRPVINKLLRWYMITHARMTENPPVVSFVPSTADRSDARLAEVMDTVFKSLWDELTMLEKLDQLFSWLIPGGAAYLKTRIDIDSGPLREWVGPAVVEYENGSGPEERFIRHAPFDEEGNPLVEITDGGQGWRKTGDPHRTHEGELQVEVLSPLEVRGQWGSNIPWRKKRWHMHRSLLTPGEVKDIFGVEVEPNITGPQEGGTGEFWRLLFGSGYYGAASNEPGSWGSTGPVGNGPGLVQVDELWHAPSSVLPGMERDRGSPGGRLLITAGSDTVIYDGERPVDLEYTSPIQKFSFVNLPGRPDATSPQEMLNPLQRTYNRGIAQLLEHRNLQSNPITVVDGMSGIEEEQLTNKPGLVLKNVRRRPNVPAVEFVKPPNMSEDVYRIQGMLDNQLDELGAMGGTSGRPPTEDASGKLVQELRYNTDRFLGPTLRRAALRLRHVVEDWMAYLPIIWDQPKIVSYAGDEQVAQTVTVYPELFEKGNANVRVDMESMFPESRQQRKKRIFKMYQAGLFGQPGSPPARKRYFELANYPHMDRAMEPGGVDHVTAQKENGQLTRGVPHDEIPVLQTYDHQVHLQVHRKFVNSPEFLEMPKSVQFNFMLHLRAHIQYIQQQEAGAIAQEARKIAALSQASGESGTGIGGAPGSASPMRDIAQRSGGDVVPTEAGNAANPNVGAGGAEQDLEEAFAAR